MYRRQFLQTLNFMGASFTLLEPASPDEHASIIEPTTTQILTVPTKVPKVAANGWDAPKVGVIVVGGLGFTILSDLAGRLPYLSRAIAIDTDVVSLQRVKADRKILVSDSKALPFNPHAVRLRAKSYHPEIANAVADLDMVFLVAGMGGAVGSDLSPLVAKMLHEQDILTLAFATLPFNFESPQHKQIAQTAMRELRVHVDALLPFSNGYVEQVAGEVSSVTCVSSQAALVLDHLWHCILNPVCRPGLINIDFEDLRHIILSHEGDCAFGFGSASCAEGAEVATRKAIDHPLLGQLQLRRASAALIAVRSSQRTALLQESKNVLRSIRNQLHPDAWVIYGAHHDDTLGDEITVSVLASGIRNA